MASLLKRLPQASTPAALGGLLSLSAQGLFALFLLKLFDATAVGIFSTLSQIAFCWATLALAQSPLSLLANHSLPPAQAAIRAWRQSLQRLLWIAPAIIAMLLWVWPTELRQTGTLLNLTVDLVWVTALALTQMTWFMAQSLSVRMLRPIHTGLVRGVPPLLAAAAAWIGAYLLGYRNDVTLLLAACLGYAVGALWFLPAFGAGLAHPSRTPTDAASVTVSSEPDNRSARLRLLHTLVDMGGSTLLAVQWTRLFGAPETGYLLILLRIFGFIPGLVHTAWSQILLGIGQSRVRASGLMAFLAMLAILCIAGAIHGALAMGWLDASWQGIKDYLLPITLWQMLACANAAHFHLAFLRGKARTYSLQCMSINGGLLLLLFLLPLWQTGPVTMIRIMAGFMVVALATQVFYLRRA